MNKSELFLQVRARMDRFYSSYFTSSHPREINSTELGPEFSNKTNTVYEYHPRASIIYRGVRVADGNIKEFGHDDILFEKRNGKIVNRLRGEELVDQCNGSALSSGEYMEWHHRSKSSSSKSLAS